MEGARNDDVAEAEMIVGVSEHVVACGKSAGNDEVA